MKQILFISFAALLMTACQKNDIVEDDEMGTPRTAASLTGKWELRSVHANVAHCCDYAPGNGRILKFNGNQYEKYEKNVLTKSGSFIVITDTTGGSNGCRTVRAGTFPNRLVYDSNFAATKIFFQLIKGQLTLVSGCFAADSGVSETYDPIQ